MHLWSVLHSFYSVNPPSRASAPTIQTDLCNITVRKCSLQFLLHHVVDHILLFEIIAFRGFSGFIGLSCHLSDSSGYSSKPPFWSLSHLMFTVYWGSTRLCPGSTLFSFYMVFFAVLVTPTVITAIYTLWDLTFSVALSLFWNPCLCLQRPTGEHHWKTPESPETQYSQTWTHSLSPWPTLRTFLLQDPHFREWPLGCDPSPHSHPCQFSLGHHFASPEDTLQIHLIFSFPIDTALIQTINLCLDYCNRFDSRRYPLASFQNSLYITTRVFLKFFLK